MGLQRRILGKGCARLFGLGQAKRIRAGDGNCKGLQQLADFPHLAGIVAGNDQLAVFEPACHVLHLSCCLLLDAKRLALHLDQILCAVAGQIEELGELGA